MPVRSPLISGFGADAESNVAGTDSSDRVFGATVMANAFDTLGIHPLVGNFFTRDEDRTDKTLSSCLATGTGSSDSDKIRM